MTLKNTICSQIYGNSHIGGKFKPLWRLELDPHTVKLTLDSALNQRLESSLGLAFCDSTNICCPSK